MKKALSHYEEKVDYYRNKVYEQIKKMDRYGNFRLLIFVLIISGILLIFKNKILLGIVTTILSIICFIVLGILHNRAFDKKKEFEILKSINEKGIHRVNGEWKKFDENGMEFEDDNHKYSNDLDIFGNNSVFQFINSAVTYFGKQKLAKILINPLKSKKDVLDVQEALKELALKVDWRQDLQMICSKDEETKSDTNELIQWAKEVNSKVLQSSAKLIYIGLTINFFIISLIASFGFIQKYYILVPLAINLIVLKLNVTQRHNKLKVVSYYKRGLWGFYNSLKSIETNKFDSSLLKNVSNMLKEKSDDLAYIQLNKLSKIADLIDNRSSQLYFIFNWVFMLDYHFEIILEKWKLKYGNNIELYLDVIAEFEALSSMSNVVFENDNWVFPNIEEKEDLYIKSIEIGHPLMTKNRVDNNVNIEKPNKVLLITGSNMSGKSTLLRTVGLNVVFALIGLPVCSKEFSCTIMDVYTCMRTKDDLEKEISSFYAEILRIKKIVDNVKHTKILFLLDEIFKGTNSYDRHDGAKSLITELTQKSVLGLVSTHDLELSSLEKENKNVKNYHFEEYYKDDKICFEYKLKDGVSKTRNARYLMRLAGINIKE